MPGRTPPAGDLWPLLWAHRERLLRIARRRSPTLEDAEDAVSEAITRCAAFPGLDVARVGELLTAATIRVCVDRLRAETTQRKAAPLLWERESRELDAAERVLDEAEAAWLARAVRLTPAERAALEARAAGLTTPEAAAVLGVTVKSADSALTRARRKCIAAWRATLAALLLLRAGRRRARGTPAVAGSIIITVAAATAVLTGPATPHRPRLDLGPADTAPAAYAPQPAAAAPVAPPRAAATSSPPPPRASTPSKPIARPSPDADPYVEAVPPVAGPLWHDGTVVEVDDDETLPERAQRCLRNGVDVDPGRLHVVCREDD